MQDRMNERYYISSGEKNKMYTLRVSFIEPVWAMNSYGKYYVANATPRDWHVKTLSNNKEKALAKAKELVGKDLEIGFELFDRAKAGEGENHIARQNPDVLMFGKYYGRLVVDIMEEDVDYLIWVAENMQSKKHEAVIENVKNLLKPVLEERKKERAEAQKEENVKAKARQEILEPVGRALMTLSWNFPQEIGMDMAMNGTLPKGRGKHLVCDMMGKMQGRRNSKKYKAEYERVEKILEIAEAV